MTQSRPESPRKYLRTRPAPYALVSVMLLIAFALLPQALYAQATIPITVFNYFKFFRVIGPNNFACYLDSPSTPRLYGEIEQVTLPDGTIREDFLVMPRDTFVRVLNRFDVQIANLKRAVARARRDDRSAAVTRLNRSLRSRASLRREYAAVVAGCKTYLRDQSELARPLFPVPTPTPLPAAGDCPESDVYGITNGFEAQELPSRLIGVSPGPNTLQFYVDPTFGDDSAPGRGLSAGAPLRSIARAKQLAVEASVSGRAPHVIRLRRGRTFSEGFGAWPLSGLKHTEPFILSTYGPGSEPRPVVSGSIHVGGNRSQLMISGIELRAPQRDPSAPDFNLNAPDISAITIDGGAKNVLIQDVLIRFYSRGIVVRGPGRTGQAQSRQIHIYRNHIYDLWSATGPALGIDLENTSDVTLINNYIGRVGNISGVGTQSDPGSTAINAATIECSVKLRENVIYGTRTGLNIAGTVRDEFNQIQPYTNDVSLLGNVFWGNTIAAVLDTSTIFATQNATMRATRLGNATSVGGWDLRNVSVLTMFFNVFANNVGPTHFWSDFGLKISGLMNLGRYDVYNNDFYRVAGALKLGPAGWYTSMRMRNEIGQVRDVPVNFAPSDLLFKDNTYYAEDATSALITHIRGETSQAADYVHRRERYHNPTTNEILFAHEERGTIIDRSSLTVGGFPGCATRITLSPSNYRQQNGYYNGDILGRGNPAEGGLQLPISDFDAPNRHRFSSTCFGSGPLSVGQSVYVFGRHTPARWLTYANVLAPNDPNGMRLSAVVKVDPNRDLLAFAQAANLRVVGPNGALKPIETEAEFFDYVHRGDIHQAAQNMSYDLRLLFLQGFLRGGFVPPGS